MQYLFRIILIVPAFLYGIIVWLRNKMYDQEILHEQHFDFPIINVGNLAAGGTGKTPHIAFLVQLLRQEYHVATLSRGYKRNTSGYRQVLVESGEEEVGDEPYLLKLKFPDCNVFVGEDRLLAIPQILQQQPGTEVILLDDAFQHRSVVAGLNILLTEYERPFYDDNILPLGYLRDVRSSYERADIIIVTKCPKDLSKEAQQEIITRIKPFSYQRVFFSSIKYQGMYAFDQELSAPTIHQGNHLCILAGIANATPLVKHLNQFSTNITLKKYPDHHRYTLTEINEWMTQFKQDPHMIFITTEKDIVRLIKFKQEIQAARLPLYVLPIDIEFIGENASKFIDYIRLYVFQQLVSIGRINNESFLE